ncbi:MAG: response regulator [Hyphomicrobiales bacterium]|nr:response regulator [Hyphomicrobiales bacterium]
MPDSVTTTKIYVVDDDQSVRDSLCALLSAHRFHPVDFASSEAFLEGFEPETALCAFVDLRMPGMSGLELQRLLADRAITLPIIILTAHGDVPLAVEAMKWGAIDFIEKPGSEAQLLAAIQIAGNQLANRPQPGIPPSIVSERLARLTGREKEVLEHLILGMTNKNIASVLGISQRTIEIHRSRIRDKMEARGLADLIRMMK